MASNKDKSTLSLQQVLCSALNNKPDNYVSEEELSEEDYDYNDLVTKDWIGNFRFYINKLW